jgi:hypothetical protein
MPTSCSMLLERWRREGLEVHHNIPSTQKRGSDGNGAVSTPLKQEVRAWYVEAEAAVDAGSLKSAASR